MEDIGQKISALLNSPDGMNQLKTLAQGLLSNNSAESQKSNDEQQSEGFSLPDNILNNMENIGGIMRIMNLLGKEQRDSRIELLLALKPHLSVERAARVDKAVSILKVARIIPLLREEDLLDSLGF